MVKTLTFEDILGIVLKKWWIVLFSFILCGILAYTYTQFFIKPTFISKGTLYINNKNVNNTNPSANTNVNASDLSVALKLVDTYSVILKSDRFMKIVVEKIGLDYSYEDIKSMVSLKGVNETEVLQVSVTSRNPEHAKIIAQVILENSKSEIIRVVEAGSVKIIDDASSPIFPSYPSKKNNTIIGMLLGLFISVGLILLVEILDISVKDEEDLENNYGIPVVGSIPNLEQLNLNAYKATNEGSGSSVQNK